MNLIEPQGKDPETFTATNYSSDVELDQKEVDDYITTLTEEVCSRNINVGSNVIIRNDDKVLVGIVKEVNDNCYNIECMEPCGINRFRCKCPSDIQQICDN